MLPGNVGVQVNEVQHVIRNTVPAPYSGLYGWDSHVPVVFRSTHTKTGLNLRILFGRSTRRELGEAIRRLSTPDCKSVTSVEEGREECWLEAS